MRRPLLLALGILVGAFVLLQLVPYGHDHGAPPTTKRASLPGAADRIAAGACKDCHSNATRWPWYTNVAPASLLVVNDVKGGRSRMNLSRWDKPQPDLAEIVRAIDGHGMPPVQYKLIHGDSRLSTAQRRTLIAGFRALYAADPPPTRGGD
jgi:heme-binding protein